MSVGRRAFCAMMPAALGSALAAKPARAQGASGFPNRPLRLVLSFPAGGLADNLARALAPAISAALGQPLVVDPRPGGSQVVAAQAVARAAPDGHTLLLASDAAYTLNQHLFSKLPYDPQRDLTPVTLLAATVECLLVPASFPARSVAELVALAKSKPGVLNYGSFGPGSPPHIEAEAFRAATGIEIVHVPFRGVAETVPALLADQIQILFASQAQALPHVRAGTLRALAVLDSARQPTLPEVPSIAEAGFPGLVARSWFGVAATAGTPEPALERLSAAFSEAMAAPEWKERFLDAQGLVAVPGGRAAFAAVLREEGGRAAERLRAMDLRLD
ncbi:tripartite tricarboxylate transporter substrate binding protein [Roseomonas sp. KE2513]|uniref:Bug family tripartite tricarboxylate transporter substrate binding protein n=1 Tax=Roseomonas sp. KE2513 TaxID=2479202 RepID=UPI0018DF19AA|nr:tripartite tricarboxylate transporter substrate binding protein [Roseomonas sp. KE2513]MBI0538586.1 tripartite tricarboxylate transporter substrate binding protein [Roseomonas sp. KE2513]